MSPLDPALSPAQHIFREVTTRERENGFKTSFASFEAMRVGHPAIHLGRRGHTVKFLPVPLFHCVLTFSSFEVILLCTPSWGQTHDPSTSAHPPSSALQSPWRKRYCFPSNSSLGSTWREGDRRLAVGVETGSSSRDEKWNLDTGAMETLSLHCCLLRQLRTTLHRQPVILQAYHPVTHSRQKEDWGDASVGTG